MSAIEQRVRMPPANVKSMRNDKDRVRSGLLTLMGGLAGAAAAFMLWPQPGGVQRRGQIATRIRDGLRRRGKAHARTGLGGTFELLERHPPKDASSKES
jgi:hypothetical protein